jgi:hemoglobin-like flavoprotein
MTSQQIQLVQTTWNSVAPISEQAATLFYGRLFELDPELKPLFKSDIREQGRKLMQMLSMTVRGLNDPAKLLPAVEDLGRRHIDYGVRSRDYDTVGSALLWTLEKGLGKASTSEVKEAWSAAYGLLASAMRQAAAKQLGCSS